MVPSRTAAGAVAALAVAAILLGVLLPGGSSVPGTGRARVYTAASACLLTDGHGLAGAQAAQAWSRIRSAVDRAVTAGVPSG